MKTKRFASAVFVAVALLSPAFAADEKAYSGAVCKPAVATDAYKVDYPIGFTGIGIKNTNGDNQPIPIVCPIVTDSLTDTSGTGSVKVFWTANPLIPSATYCVRPEKFNPRRVRFPGTVWGHGPEPGLIRIPNITADDRFGPYSVDCQLPKGSVLNSIWINENGTS